MENEGREKTALKAQSVYSEGNQFVSRVTSLWEKHETENFSWIFFLKHYFNFNFVGFIKLISYAEIANRQFNKSNTS